MKDRDYEKLKKKIDDFLDSKTPLELAHLMQSYGVNYPWLKARGL